jgi:hypothetical protein
MFAYVDETGNTGGNLFDPEQPWLVTVGLMTKANFDVLERTLFHAGDADGETDFHANEVGFEKIERIAPRVLAVSKKRDARFFISRVEKLYLATAKVIDTVFDSYENKAVPWHVYNLRPLKLILLFKLAHYVLDEDMVRLFWESLMHKNSKRASELFVDACRAILVRVNNLPDKRSREIARKAFTWAIENYDRITVHSETKLIRYGHMPNMVAFTNLIDGIERQSQAWGKSVKIIKHDRQNQFEKSLAFVHELCANPDPTPIEWPSMGKYSLQKVNGSKFVVANRFESPGIQLVDIVLWLFGRMNRGDDLSEHSHRFMKYALSKGYYNDFSFDGVYYNLDKEMRPVMEAPFSEEQLAMAKEMIERSEERRLADMHQPDMHRAVAARFYPKNQAS